MLSTMQDRPLTINHIFEHGRRVHSDSEIVTFMGDDSRRASYAQVANRAELLASALKKLGVKEGDRIGTFAWNTQEHMEAYFAIPCMGAVLHTLNLRLFPEQLSYIINHAEDRIIIIDDSLIPLLAKVVKDLKKVERYIVVGSGDSSALGEVLRYEELIGAEKLG